jgi:hypothetical protein
VSEGRLDCPACGRAIALGRDQLIWKRAFCPGCGAGLELAPPVEIGDGPLRSMSIPRVRLLPTPAPAGVIELGAEGAQLRVALALPNDPAANRFVQVVIALAYAAGIATAVVTNRSELAILALPLGLLVGGAARLRRGWRREEITIRDGELVDRRGIFRTRTRRVALGRIRAVEQTWLRGGLPAVKLTVEGEPALELGMGTTGDALAWLLARLGRVVRQAAAPREGTG